MSICKRTAESQFVDAICLKRRLDGNDFDLRLAKQRFDAGETAFAFLRKCSAGIGQLADHAQESVAFAATCGAATSGWLPPPAPGSCITIRNCSFIISLNRARPMRSPSGSSELISFRMLKLRSSKRLLRVPDIDQCTQRGFDRRALLDLPVQLRSLALDRGFPRQLAFNVPPRLRPVGAQPDQRLQQRRAVGGHENPFHHCIACVGEGIQTFHDPIRCRLFDLQEGIIARNLPGD